MIERITRSQFIKILIGFFAAIWTGLATYPVFRYLLSGAKRKIDDGAQITTLSLGKVADFIPGASKNFKFGSIPAILIRTDDGNFFAYNAICTHLGCTVQYSNEKKKIWCACHGGQFDPISGKNVSGPPPKPLSALKVSVVNEEIIVSKV